MSKGPRVHRNKTGSLTPEGCVARWRNPWASGNDRRRMPEPSGDNLVIRACRGTTRGRPLTMFVLGGVFGVPLLLGIYFLVSRQQLFFGGFLILVLGLPVTLILAALLAEVSALRYDSNFIPPRLSVNRASLVPGMVGTVHYRHLRRNARRTIHGFVLTKLVAVIHTQVPHIPATPEGLYTETRHRVVWSSEVEVHTLDPNTAGMSVDQVTEIPRGVPDTGPLPLEGNELKKEVVWYFRVYEVTLPRAFGTYDFIVPVGSAPDKLPHLPQVSG